MVRIEWDVDEEIEVNKKKALKILNNFPAVDGLEDVLKQTQDLVYSSFFKELYDGRFSVLDDFFKVNGAFFEDRFDSRLDDYPQFKYATVLPNQKFYIPFLYKGVIARDYFTNFILLLILIISLKKNEVFSHQKYMLFLDRVMVLLDDFDKDIPFDTPDLDFFKALKDIHWDKKGKKLFDKVSSILRHVIELVSDGEFSSYEASFANSIFFGLVFLTGCVCVGRGSSRMSVDDVVVAYRIFFKLLDCSVDDIIL